VFDFLMKLILFFMAVAASAQIPPFPTNDFDFDTNSPHVFPNDPLCSANTNRFISWANGSGYEANTYQYYIRNTGDPIQMRSGSSVASVESGTSSAHFSEAWSRLSESTVPVAVIDPYGFDPSHEDLASNIVLCTNVDGGPVPVADHGNGVASIIGAVGNNGIGMAGICWKVPLVLIKFEVRSDATSFSNAVNVALSNGVKVICFPSWCYGNESNSNTMVRIRDADVLFVCSTPNSPVNLETSPDYPSSWKFRNVLPVSCSMMNGDLLYGGAAWGSNTVFCAAPGRRVPICTTSNQYGFSTGSSYSAGVVAGLAALLRTRFPGDSFEATRFRIASAITPIGHETLTGGVVDAGAISTTILRISVAGDGSKIQSSQDLDDWSVWFARTNNQKQFFKTGN